MDHLSELRAKLDKSSVLAEQGKLLLKIEDNKPVTFFVLEGNYSSVGGWYHPCGVHFVHKKQITCREIAKAGTCSICERIRTMQQQGAPESEIFRIRAPLKYAMNVLVKGEGIPRVFLAPESVFEEIKRAWDVGLQQDPKINIFNPEDSVVWTVTRKEKGKTYYYEVVFADQSLPIVTGDNAEERLRSILRSAANLDKRFRLPGH